jgi:hypothetical protein
VEAAQRPYTITYAAVLSYNNYILGLFTHINNYFGHVVDKKHQSFSLLLLNRFKYQGHLLGLRGTNSSTQFDNH